jgi:phosphoribosylaminoimidazole-succinocarboxamide synthase
MNGKLLTSSDFSGLKLIKRGKVRDIYEIENYYLIVATDRVSAFDVVMNEPIPYKGSVLTQISKFWFEHFSSLIKNHIVSTNVDDYPEVCKPYKSDLEGRSMLVVKAKPLAIECIVRGYISGSGWKEYKKNQSICGIKLPADLKESDKLPEPIFTPSTKADIGHDENISFEKACEIVGKETADKVKEYTIGIYKKAHDYAYERGIIIADTKMEFGVLNGEIIIIDELLTPDSSRFWPLSKFQPGRGQESFDKQFLRDYLLSLDWNQSPPPPPLPEEIINTTSAKYLDAYKLLTGIKLI